MNLRSLDAKLRELSESERKYKSGVKNSAWQENFLADTPIPCIPFSRLHEAENPHRRLGGTLPLEIPGLNISINRNSRYSPVPMHTHDYLEMSYVYSGTVPETIGHTRITMQTGQVLLLDTNEPHAIGLLQENDILINLHLSKKYLHENLFRHLSRESILADFFVNALTKNASHERFILFHSENSRRIPLFFNELLCECYDPSVNSADVAANLIGLIIAELINVYETDLFQNEINAGDISVVPIIHYIGANFRTCTRKGVADLFHINEKYLTALLKKHTGMTYKQLVLSQRLKYAAKLLANTTMPIADVAAECGYENLNFFYRKFREEYGVSPKVYREGGDK